MKITCCLAVWGLFLTSSMAQELMPLSAGCNYAAANPAKELYTYDASAEALQIVERIMRVNVLPQNFVVRAADCANAVATTADGQRYILYSTAFLENFKKEANTQWAAYSVLAHEVGHHLSNHDLTETDPRIRKRYELEADRFSGGMLYRMGATLEEAQAGINTFSLEGESSTHPGKRARLEAVAVGWKQAAELAADAEMSTGAAAADSEEKKLFKQSQAETDPLKAIDLLDQAIDLKEDYADAYLERGKRKVDMENHEAYAYRTDYAGAVDDYTVYLQMRPKDPEAYLERGYAYSGLGEPDKALDDYNRAIRLDRKNPEAFMLRAWVTMRDDGEAALKDLEQAVALDPKLAEAHYWHGNILYGFGEYDKAIADFDKALAIDPKYFHAADLRAAACQFGGHYAEAVAGYNQAQTLAPEQFTGFINRGQCYQALGKHREAIADFDEVVRRYPDASDGYLFRGVSKSVLGQKAEAKQDFDLVFENTSMVISASIRIGCLLIDSGLPDEGLPWLDKVLAENPDNAQALECRARAK